jgi:hypothetical protein
MGGPREATTLGEGTAAVRQKVGRLSHLAIIRLGLIPPIRADERDAFRHSYRSAAKPIGLSTGCRVAKSPSIISIRAGGKVSRAPHRSSAPARSYPF